MSDQTQNPQVMPEGYMKNDKGYLIPIDKIKPLDKLRDETVKKMVSIGKELHEQMVIQKELLFGLFNDFVELSASEYEVVLGGKKGNITLKSFDGQYQAQIAVSENIVFDERLQIAKQLIDECIHAWSEGSNENIRALINGAFQVDKEGKISTGRVLSLRRLDITDDKWIRAMQAIGDAITITDTKEYIRLYERGEDGKYSQISLDFASL